MSHCWVRQNESPAGWPRTEADGVHCGPLLSRQNSMQWPGSKAWFYHVFVGDLGHFLSESSKRWYQVQPCCPLFWLWIGIARQEAKWPNVVLESSKRIFFLNAMIYLKISHLGGVWDDRRTWFMEEDTIYRIIRISCICGCILQKTSHLQSCLILLCIMVLHIMITISQIENWGLHSTL